MKALAGMLIIGSGLLCLMEPRAAHALTVPDTGTCTGTGVCLGITAPGSNLSNVAVQGTATTGIAGFSSDSSAEGVFGDGSSGAAGVYGISDTATGVYGKSTSQFGVQGLSTCSTGGSCIGVYGTSSGGNGLWGNTSSTSNAAVVGISPSGGLAFYGAGGIIITGSLAQKAGGGSWTAPSDGRIKKDVADFGQGLAEIMRVRPVRFKYNGLGGMANDGKEYVGVIAQELQHVIPAMVGSHTAKLRPTDTTETAILQVDPSEFTYLLINAVKQQQTTIQRQEARIAALEQGRAPVASSIMPFDALGGRVAIAMLPIGLFIAVRRRKNTHQN